MRRLRRMWALSIQPKIPVIWVGTSNGTDHFGLVRPEYSGPALKVVHFDRSGYLGRSDRNVPFHSTNLLSPVPLFRIVLTKTITKRAVAWVCVTGMYRSIGHVEFPKFQTGMESALYFHVSWSSKDDYANSFWRQDLRSSACNLSVFAVLFNYSLLSNRAFFLRSVVGRVKQLTHIRKHSTT